MHSLAVYVKEGLPFAHNLFLENSADSQYLCFQLALLHSVSYFFFLYLSLSSLCMVFDSTSSNTDEVLSINPSANVFVPGDLRPSKRLAKSKLNCSSVQHNTVKNSVCYAFYFITTANKHSVFLLFMKSKGTTLVFYYVFSNLFVLALSYRFTTLYSL